MKNLFKEMNKFELIGTVLVFALVIAGCILSYIQPEFFRYKYTVEDGPLETMTVFFLLTGSFTCIYRVFKLKSEKKTLFLMCTCILAALFFFGAGEEISWGQRIFDIQSNEFFKKHNTQGETTLHNLSFTNSDGKKVKINKLVFSKILTISIIIYMLILPPLYRRKEKIKNLVDSFAIPLPQTRQVILYALLAAIVLSIGHKRKGELLEFGGCFLFLMITLFPYNKFNFLLKKDQPTVK